MFTLITGGTASGKSECAETMAVSSGAENLYYVATMKPEGEASAERIEKHRRARADKNFITMECPAGLKYLKIPAPPEKSIILLEDLGNLVANEQFDEGGTDADIIQRVTEGIISLCRSAFHVYVVGDDVFSDTGDYGVETLRYIRLLGEVTKMAADMADSVWHIVYGIAIPCKDEISGDWRHEKKEQVSSA